MIHLQLFYLWNSGELQFKFRTLFKQ